MSALLIGVDVTDDEWAQPMSSVTENSYSLSYYQEIMTKWIYLPYTLWQKLGTCLTIISETINQAQHGQY